MQALADAGQLSGCDVDALLLGFRASAGYQRAFPGLGAVAHHLELSFHRLDGARQIGQLPRDTAGRHDCYAVLLLRQLVRS